MPGCPLLLRYFAEKNFLAYRFLQSTQGYGRATLVYAVECCKQWFSSGGVSTPRRSPNRVSRVMRIVVLVVAWWVVSAEAQVVTYEEGFATGIVGLSVGSSIYDVVFVDGSYNTIYATNPPVFLGHPAEASAAAAVIQARLNAEPLLPRLNTVHSFEALSVPHTFAAATAPGDMVASRIRLRVGEGLWSQFGDIRVDRDVIWNSHAVFTFSGPVLAPPSPVPAFQTWALWVLAIIAGFLAIRQLRFGH